MNRKLLFFVNVDWFFLSHRIPIAIEALKNGYDVYLFTKTTGKENIIKSKGINVIDINISRSGINLFNEIYVIIKSLKVIKKINPDIIHNVGLKPIIYGSICSRILNIKKTINAISGLGYNFTDRKNKFQSLLLWLMKIILKSQKFNFIFQNQDDLDFFRKEKILSKKSKSFIIPGSGVDLKLYSNKIELKNKKLKILFPARLLYDKGIKEVKEASLLLKPFYESKIQFLLAGEIDTDNPSSISKNFLNDWVDNKYVKWLGHVDNIHNLFCNVDIVILPSYREGLPKSLCEACAAGKPIITCDTIGCRECVDDGNNGILIPKKNSLALADAIKKLLNNKSLREIMSFNSLKKATLHFDVQKIIAQHMIIYKK